MSAPAAPRARALLTNPVLVWAIVLLLLIPVAIRMFQILVVGTDVRVVDFDVFYIASQLIGEGQAVLAYDPGVMTARQSAMAGDHMFMPWAYPPQFDLLIAPLALVSRGIGYGIFSVLSLTAYMVVLRRLAGPWLPGVLLAIFPCLLIIAPIGQSSLIVAALIGLVCAMWTENRGAAATGIPLGLLVIKPHLAIGLGFAVLAERKWKVLLWAGAVVALSSALATLVFGPGIWSAFRESSAAATERMAHGQFKLYRMTSVYASLLSLRLAPSVALAGHVAVALAALTAVGIAVRRGWPVQRVLGISVIATLTISPYSYDYDMPILGVALALLARDLVELSRPAERIVLLAALWFWAGGASFIAVILNHGREEDQYSWLAAGSLGLLLSAGLIGRILRRCPARPGAATLPSHRP